MERRVSKSNGYISNPFPHDVGIHLVIGGEDITLYTQCLKPSSMYVDYNGYLWDQ